MANGGESPSAIGHRRCCHVIVVDARDHHPTTTTQPPSSRESLVSSWSLEAPNTTANPILHTRRRRVVSSLDPSRDDASGRASACARQSASFDMTSRCCVSSSALTAHEWNAARRAWSHLPGGRPSRVACVVPCSPRVPSESNDSLSVRPTSCDARWMFSFSASGLLHCHCRILQVWHPWTSLRGCAPRRSAARAVQLGPGGDPLALPAWMPPARRRQFPFDRPIVFRVGRYAVHRVGTEPIGVVTVPVWEELKQ